MTSGDSGGRGEEPDPRSPEDETAGLYRTAWDLMHDLAHQVVVPLKTATAEDLPRLRHAAALFDARIRFITKAVREGDQIQPS